MKKTISLILSCMLFAGCSSANTSMKDASLQASTSPDTVTGASTTRTELSGDDYDKAIKNLEAISNDLATKADTEKSGYEEPDSKVAQVLSVNDDGTPSMSTIHAWKVEKNDDNATITVVMTDGRTISNMIQKGCKGTIIIHGDAYYILHVETENVETLEYSDETYNAGKFNSAYSGADAKLNEYTVTFDITDIESTFVYMFD